jgi:phosphoadenosine phosphosulfate reductase
MHASSRFDLSQNFFSTLSFASSEPQIKREAKMSEVVINETSRAPTTLDHLLEARLHQVLQELCLNHPKLSFANSLGQEDMVLTDMIARHQLPIEIFTLDTWRLHEETYALLNQVKRHYPPLRIEVIAPETQAVEALVSKTGINGIYDSIEARKACCSVRKIEPLKRALKDSQAWITGLRREQSEARTALSFKSTDPLTGIDKYNPLLEWSLEAVQNYLKRHEVPVNALHAQGYPSIGCAPCTRAIRVGEHPRAGRWWWEQEKAQGIESAAQECGLHVDESGRLVRTGN